MLGIGGFYIVHMVRQRRHPGVGRAQGGPVGGEMEAPVGMLEAVQEIQLFGRFRELDPAGFVGLEDDARLQPIEGPDVDDDVGAFVADAHPAAVFKAQIRAVIGVD